MVLMLWNVVEPEAADDAGMCVCVLLVVGVVVVVVVLVVDVLSVVVM